MTEKKSLFSRLREGLFKSREHRSVAMEAAVQDDRPIDEDFYDDLLDALILSDMGATCATEAIDRLRERVRAEHLRYAPQAKDALKGVLTARTADDKSVSIALTKKSDAITAISVSAGPIEQSLAKTVLEKIQGELK